MGGLNCDGNFYPRSPCGERRCDILSIERCSLFLSTLSLRRATAGKGPAVKGYRNFYPRSPCGERPLGAGSVSGTSCNFYPRSPCGERRPVVLLRVKSTSISIHALLAESDVMLVESFSDNRHFYPRSPCGERPVNIQRPTTEKNFYPRSPCGERP